MRRVSWIVLLSLAAACGGGSAAPLPAGPVKLGVTSGNNQVVTAAPLDQNRLPQNTVVQVMQLPNGQVALRTRVVDALLPEQAWAQTTVKGIANQVVCATQPDPQHKLSAEVPCATSDALGNAVFVFHADTLAGVSKAQVAAALATGTKVTDSVSATVLAGAADSNYRTGAIPIVPLPAAVPATSVVDKYGNAVAFRIVSDGKISLQDTTTGSVGARTIVSGPKDNLDHVVELRGANNVLVGHARYNIGAVGANGQLSNFIAAGVNRQP